MQRPRERITAGFDIHCVFEPADEAEAVALFEELRRYIDAHRLSYERALVFREPVGPWPTPMWQVLLRHGGAERLEADLGLCLSWLMINRGHFAIMVHPNTATDGDFGGELRDHRDYGFWLGDGPPLILEVFD